MMVVKKNAIVEFICLLLVCCGTIRSGFCGDDDSKYYNLIVRIQSSFTDGETQCGFGLIVAEFDDSLLVLTTPDAIFTFESNIKEIQKIDVTFKEGISKQARLADPLLLVRGIVALLIETPESFSWSNRYLTSEVGVGDKVRIITGDWDYQKPPLEGIVLAVGSDNIRIQCSEQKTTECYGEGGPVISDNGIVAIAIHSADYVTAIPFRPIEEFILYSQSDLASRLPSDLWSSRWIFPSASIGLNLGWGLFLGDYLGISNVEKDTVGFSTIFGGLGIELEPISLLAFKLDMEWGSGRSEIAIDDQMTTFSNAMRLTRIGCFLKLKRLTKTNKGRYWKLGLSWISRHVKITNGNAQPIVSKSAQYLELTLAHEWRWFNSKIFAGGIIGGNGKYKQLALSIGFDYLMHLKGLPKSILY